MANNGCSWAMAPEGAPEEVFQQKGIWWLVSPGLYPWVLLFASRACTGGHRHISIGGPSAIPGVPATRATQQCAPLLCAAMGMACKAAYDNWSWEQYAAGQRSLQSAAEHYVKQGGVSPLQTFPRSASSRVGGTWITTRRTVWQAPRTRARWQK